MTDIQIGGAKRARRGYSFDEVAIAPSRRTRDPEAVSTSWAIDAYRFDTPLMAAPMDSVVSPGSAITLSGLGVLAVLNLEGLWGRYEDADPLLREIAALDPDVVTPRMQALYAAQPVDNALVTARIAELKAEGVTVAVAMSPQGAARLAPLAAQAGADMVVIRGTTVSAEHVSTVGEPLNLKQFIHELDVPVIVGGCATGQAALHLMRTGAAGVLVGFGGGASHTTADVMGVRVPMASAVAEVAAARRDYLDESGGRYVHVIADGSMGRSGDIVKAFHPHLPRGERHLMKPVGTFEQVLHGPSSSADGTMNLVGALRKAMATTGYSDLKEFQRVEMVVMS